MDFVYAPPPPPPPKEEQTRKQNQNAHPNNNLANQNQKKNQKKLTPTPPPTVQPSFDSKILDLPTYLPNEKSPQDEVKLDIKEPEKNGVSLAEPVFIQGTTISLQTEEDIANWIAERKKNWPSKKNLESKTINKPEPADKVSRKPAAKRGPEEETLDAKRPKNVCRFFQQHKHCKYGNKCKNLHETPNKSFTIPSNKHDTTHYRRTINGIPVLIPKLYSSRNSSTNTSTQGLSLFKNLVQKDQYEHENNLVLEFIQFLDAQGKIDHEIMKKES